MKKTIMLLALFLAFGVFSAFAFEYGEPMVVVDTNMLKSPLKPFVLRFTEEELMSQPIWNTQVDAILVPENAPSPIMAGAEELRDTIRGYHLGEVEIISASVNGKILPKHLIGKNCIVLGVPQDFKLAASLAKQAKLDVTIDTYNEDGFHITPISQDGAQLLFVTSPVPRGVMYGAFEIEERTTHRGVPRIDQAFMPRARYRGWHMYQWKSMPPETCGHWRLNIADLSGAPRVLLNCPDYPELSAGMDVKANEEAIAWHRAQMQKNAKYGIIQRISINPLTMQFTYAGMYEGAKIMEKKFPGILARPLDENSHTFCPSHPETKRFVANSVREFMGFFPETQMVVFQMQDEGGEMQCHCGKCEQWPYYKRFIEYTNLAMDTAREINPNVRFMIYGMGACNLIKLIDGKVADGPCVGLDLLYDGLKDRLEMIQLMATSPPGFDVQSWFSPDSTAMGHGLPLYYMFKWFEAGGPAIASPISSSMSHLGWQLPVYLEKINKYLLPGMSTVGGDSLVTGVDVALWHEDLDPAVYMRNWCRVKYGEVAGNYVFNAIDETYKITNAFNVNPTTNNSITMYRWTKPGQPWSADMNGLTAIGLGHDEFKQTTIDSIAKQGFMIPDTTQPKDLQEITDVSFAKWVDRFDMLEERAIAARAEKEMGLAFTELPDNIELRQLNELAKATRALTDCYSDYHLAMVYANTARCTLDGEAKARNASLAHAHLEKVGANLNSYVANMLPITADMTPNPDLGRMKRDVEMFYLTAIACMVREGVYLFDQEFSGNLLPAFDQAIGLVK